MSIIFYIIYESTRLLTKEHDQQHVARAAFTLFFNGLVWYFLSVILLLRIIPTNVEKLPMLVLGIVVCLLAYFIFKRQFIQGLEIRENILALRGRLKWKAWQLHLFSFMYNVGGIIFAISAGIYY